MTAIARWRAHGIECAFDPDADVEGLTAQGQAALSAAVGNLDPAALARHFPRGVDGRLPLGETVLLQQLDQGPFTGKRPWLVAVSPAKRGDRQVVTVMISQEWGGNFLHRWDEARWLWDARAAATPELEKWGTTLALVRSSPAELEALELPGAREARSLLLARAGRWREALAAVNVTFDLDDLPYAKANGSRGVAPELWDEGLDSRMRQVAPWRLAGTVADHDVKLFDLPNQTVARKYCVMVRAGVHGGAHLFVGITGSNRRAAGIGWRVPPDLAIALDGEPPPIAGAAVVDVRTTTGTRTSADELYAQIAATPDDDEPRRVLADMLLARDDPRGELIALQLTVEPEPRVRTPMADLLGDEAAPGARAAKAGKVARRVRELVAAHGRAWLGPLGALVTRVTYDRGFVLRCTLGDEHTPFDAWSACLAPRALAELALVRELDLADKFPADVARALLGKLPHLERLSVPQPLVATVPRPLDLEVRIDAWDTLFDTLVAHPPRQVRFPAEGHAFWVRANHLLDRLHLLPMAVERCVIRGDGLAIALARDARGDLAVMTAACAEWRAAGRLTSLLSQITLRPSALTVHGDSGAPGALRQACQRFGIVPELA